MESNTLSFVLSYRDPEYGRFRALLESALRLKGWNLQLIQNTDTGPLCYWQTFWKLIWRQHRKGIYLLGFRGLEFYWLLRLLVGPQPIIIDALMSPSIALAEEKKSWLSVVQKWLFWMEKAIYQDAQMIVVDTESHRRLFAQTFALPLQKMQVIPVGAEEQFFSPRNLINADRERKFTVLYYFSGQQLHGGALIKEVLESFPQTDIRFLLVGPQAMAFPADPRVTVYPHLPYRLLARLIERVDLCLVGPFAQTPQAHRVITTKAYQCLALGKAVLMGENKEARKYFFHQKNALFVPLGQAKALRETILWAYRHPQRLKQIAQQGKITYDQHFSTIERARQLSTLLHSVQDHYVQNHT